MATARHPSHHRHMLASDRARRAICSRCRRHSSRSRSRFSVCYIAYVLWPRWPADRSRSMRRACRSRSAGVDLQHSAGRDPQRCSASPARRSASISPFCGRRWTPPDPERAANPGVVVEHGRPRLRDHRRERRRAAARRAREDHLSALSRNAPDPQRPGGLIVQPVPRRHALSGRGPDLRQGAPASSSAARATARGATLGMCLYDRRIGGADLTVRFPRDWLDDWQRRRGRARHADPQPARARPR